MRVVKTIGMMQAAVHVNFIIPAKFWTDHDGGVVAEDGICANPVENPADRIISCLNAMQVMLIAFMTDIMSGAFAD